MRSADPAAHPRHRDADRRASRPVSLGRFTAYVGIVGGVVTLFALSWILRDVLLIAFGSLVFAVAVRTLAQPIHRHTRLSETWAVALVVILLVLLVLGLSWLFGQQIAQQLRGLQERIPQALSEVRAWLEARPAGRFVLERLSGATEGDGGGAIAGLQKFVAIGAVTIGHAVIMFFGGVFMAANPKLYFDGFVRLFPVGYRPKLRDALLASGNALRHWLLGQGVSMLCVGLLTGIGLWIAGAPLALVLGIIAGLLNFIPVLGPTLAFGPGVLVALTDSPRTAVYAMVVYLLVQQLEGHAITPLAQRWAVKLPPAFGLLAVVSFAQLFGFFGVLFGIPLAVVSLSLVKKLYIEGALEENEPAPAPRSTALAKHSPG
jgi:predicted PurR-regulated permease PerM